MAALPATKNDPVQNAGSAKAEEPWYGGTGSLVEVALRGHFIQTPASVGNDLRAVWLLPCPFVPCFTSPQRLRCLTKLSSGGFVQGVAGTSYGTVSPRTPQSKHTCIAGRSCMWLDAAVSLVHLNKL